MISDFLNIMVLPLLACLIFTGIHSYLGYHVIQRQIIFVDLAIAQIAVLGSSLALIGGHGLDSPESYWLSLLSALAGAGILAYTRSRNQRIHQEALIGIVYVVSAALLIIVLSRYGEGDRHIRQMLSGNILLVGPSEVIKTALIYSVIGFIHWLFREKFFLISQDPEKAYAQNINVRFWDFLFYVTFGIVITSSVKIVGVLLVFAFLIVPPVCAVLLAERTIVRLAAGWILGCVACVLGITASYSLDYPTGASIVTVFGITFFLIMIKTRIGQ